MIFPEKGSLRKGKAFMKQLKFVEQHSAMTREN